MHVRKSLIKIVIMIIIVLIVLSVFSFKIALDEPVRVSVKPLPNIDIVLATGKTSTDISTFKDDLMTELKSMGINTSKVNITTTKSAITSSNAPGAENIFNEWQKVGAQGIWSYNTEGKYIVNAENTGDLTGYYNPDSFKHTTIELNYDYMSTNNDDDAMGSIIRFNQNEDGTVTTYIFLLTNAEASWCSPSRIV